MRNILPGGRSWTLILWTLYRTARNPTLSSSSLRRPFLRQRGVNTPSATLNFPPMQSLFKPRRSFCSFNHFYRSSTCSYLLRSVTSPPPPLLSFVLYRASRFLFLCCSRFGRRNIGNYRWKKLNIHPSNCCCTSECRNWRGRFFFLFHFFFCCCIVYYLILIWFRLIENLVTCSSV